MLDEKTSKKPQSNQDVLLQPQNEGWATLLCIKLCLLSSIRKWENKIFPLHIFPHLVVTVSNRQPAAELENFAQKTSKGNTIIPFSPRALWNENLFACALTSPLLIFSSPKNRIFISISLCFPSEQPTSFPTESFHLLRNAIVYIFSVQFCELLSSRERNVEKRFALSKMLMLDEGKFYYKICSRSHFSLSLATASILFGSGKGSRRIIINS